MKMAALKVETHDESVVATGLDAQRNLNYRRRHSSVHPRRKSAEYNLAMDGEEGLLLKVCLLFSYLPPFPPSPHHHQPPPPLPPPRGRLAWEERGRAGMKMNQMIWENKC